MEAFWQLLGHLGTLSCDFSGHLRSGVSNCATFCLQQEEKLAWVAQLNRSKVERTLMGWLGPIGRRRVRGEKSEKRENSQTQAGSDHKLEKNDISNSAQHYCRHCLRVMQERLETRGLGEGGEKQIRYAALSGQTPHWESISRPNQAWSRFKNLGQKNRVIWRKCLCYLGVL